jgi:hypothetical protein
VKVETGVAGLTAYMTFTNKRKYQKPLSTVDPGQTLTVIGRIEDIGSDGISVVKCKICQ